MYNFNDAKEGSNNKYLQTGIHKVKIESITFNSSEKGENFDVSIVGEGGSNKWRVFPFKFNSDFKGTQEEQLNTWLANIKHVFKKSVGEDIFEKATSNVTSFKDLADKLTKAVSAKGKEFYLTLINKKGFAAVPGWSGGFAQTVEEYNASPMTFDAAKYGKPTTPSGSFESIVSAPTVSKSDDSLDWLNS